MKIGLYFGSFNPIHTGHLIIANHVLNETEIERIWFVVSPHNPYKPSSSLLNEYNRLHLVQVAVQNDNRLKAIDIEFFLPRPSYTAHTLAHLTERYPAYEFIIIMGSDSFQNLGKWKNAETIIANFRFFIYRRPGFDVQNNIKANFSIMSAPLLEISATYIRECLQKGKSIRYLVPISVEEEIEKGSFYKRSYKK